jgi:hypothetical protein
MWDSLFAIFFEERDEALLDVGRARYHERPRPTSSGVRWHTSIAIRAESSGDVEFSTLEDTTGQFESLPKGRFTFEAATRSVSNVESGAETPMLVPFACLIWPPRIESLLSVLRQNEDGHLAKYIGDPSADLIETCIHLAVLRPDEFRATIDSRLNVMISWEAIIEGEVAMLAQLRDVATS